MAVVLQILTIAGGIRCSTLNTLYPGVVLRGFRSPMKPMTIAGAMLVLLGVLALAYQGVNYTTRETIIDIGPLQATADRERTLPLPPVLGIAALVGGVLLLISRARKHA